MPSRLAGPVRFGCIVVALAALFAVMAVWLGTGGKPGDAYTYLAAGQRLNAGHQLYALSDGDNPVLLNPPYWTVPLLSPPLMGILWRPLAVLPQDLGVYVWWLAVIASSSLVIGQFLGRRPLVAGPAVFLLSVSLVVQIGVANVDGLLMSGIVGVWLLARGGREREAGAIVAIMAAIKVTPVVLAWWLLMSGRPRGVVAFALVALGTLAVSLAGAGLESHLRYLQIVAETGATGSTPGSLAGLGRLVGIPPEMARYFPMAALVAGLGLMVVLRKRHGVTFSIAAALMVLGSPSVAFHTPALLLTALAPLAWPKVRAAAPTAYDPALAVSRAAV